MVQQGRHCRKTTVQPARKRRPSWPAQLNFSPHGLLSVKADITVNTHLPVELTPTSSYQQHLPGQWERSISPQSHLHPKLCYHSTNSSLIEMRFILQSFSDVKRATPQGVATSKATSQPPYCSDCKCIACFNTTLLNILCKDPPITSQVLQYYLPSVYFRSLLWEKSSNLLLCTQDSMYVLLFTTLTLFPQRVSIKVITKYITLEFPQGCLVFKYW